MTEIAEKVPQAEILSQLEEEIADVAVCLDEVKGLNAGRIRRVQREKNWRWRDKLYRNGIR